MEYAIVLQKYQTGQHEELTRVFSQELWQMPEFNSEFGDILKEIERFFQKPPWVSNVCNFEPNGNFSKIARSNLLSVARIFRR